MSRLTGSTPRATPSQSKAPNISTIAHQPIIGRPRLDDSSESKVIVRAILGIAKGFGLTTTAEGIEGAEQLAYLKANGCTEGQGYLFSKAIPADDIPSLINRPTNYSAVA